VWIQVRSLAVDASDLPCIRAGDAAESQEADALASPDKFHTAGFAIGALQQALAIYDKRNSAGQET